MLFESILGHTLIQADNTWGLLGVMVISVFLAIYLEQKYDWASKISGCIIALLMAMVIVLQFVGSMIPPIGGTVSISLVLIPIIVGAAIYAINNYPSHSFRMSKVPYLLSVDNTPYSLYDYGTDYCTYSNDGKSK